MGGHRRSQENIGTNLLNVPATGPIRKWGHTIEKRHFIGVSMETSENHTELDRDVAILISSCDAFQDLWQPFFTLFWRYWPDCPYRLFLITNGLRFDDPNVTSIQVGTDRHWASNCRVALTRIPHPFVLYLQEDYLLRNSVDTSRVRKLVSCFQRMKAGCMRLYPCPGPDLQVPGNDEVGLVRKGAPYRVSLQAAVWRKEVLEGLLMDGETGWEMELEGSRRSDSLEIPFLSVMMDSSTGENTNPPIPYFSQSVVKGKWTRQAVRLCVMEGIPVNLRRRAVYTWWEEMWEKSIVRRSCGQSRRRIGERLRRYGVLGAPRAGTAGK